MSNRLAPPPPVARWPFFLGDLILFGIAAVGLLAGEAAPGIGAIIIATVCVGGGVALFVAPFILDYEARLRVAEAAVHDTVETQIRRLTQTTEQLAQAVSRSQSTEEQAGHALGTLEELSEKLTAQAGELAQNLTRNNERELAALKAELGRVNRERDERLGALEERIDALAATLAENQSAAARAMTATTRTLDDVKDRLIALVARLDGVAAPPPRPPEPAVSPPPPTAAPPAVTKPAASAPSAPGGAARPENGAAETTVPAPPPTATPSPSSASLPATTPKPRARRAADGDGDGDAPPKVAAKPTTLELPLEETGESRRPAAAPARRENGGSSTSLVATAYIGIGNKLFVRGQGPGLSWDQGVPMQFLAIGKWGWTTADADMPITCRIYRNDDTPMLDENIVIAPGAKAEITPRF